MEWIFGNKTITFQKTLLMGVINITPDSFSDGGKFESADSALGQALKLTREGADILDLGAESSRPNAEALSGQEELERLIPVLQAIREKTSTLISVDTTKAEVARECLQCGADIVNDISGLHDSGGELADVVREFNAGLILMHRRGNAKTMQSMTQYDDLIADVLAELKVSVDLALKRGVKLEQIVVDPGIGFAKDAEQNLKILRELEQFHHLKRPILLGPSRKSFIGHVTGREVHAREFGTAAVIADAVLKGIQIVRVHNVGAMRDVVLMTEAIRRKNNHVRT